MTVIARLPELYFGAFRLDHDRLEAGDVTKFMACPWQADFYECRDDWWPAQRPDTVITEAEIKEITQDFEVAPSDPNLLFFDRVRWDRSLDRRPWPDTEYVAAKLASRPGEGVREFVRRIGTLAVDALVARPSPIPRKPPRQSLARPIPDPGEVWIRSRDGAFFPAHPPPTRSFRRAKARRRSAKCSTGSAKP